MSLRAELDAAIASAGHLLAQDNAAIALARKMADYLDEAVAGGFETTHRAMYGPNATYHKILTGLGLTPEGRKLLELKAESKGGKLAAIRAERTVRA